MSRARRERRMDGYTLVEIVAVMTVLGILGMVGFQVVLSAMGVYTRSAPAMEAGYDARLAARRLRSDLRDLGSTDSITTFDPTALTFDDSSSDTIAYALDGTTLKRNGDVLAEGVTALAISYWQADGTAAVNAADIHLVEVALTVASGDQSHVVRSTIFPRVLTALPEASEGEGGEGGGGGGGGGGSSGLIAHWDFDETSGTTVADNVGGNDGTLTNGPTLTSSGPSSGATAVKLDGSNDYVLIPHDDAYLIDEGTIQLWVRADDTSGKKALFSKDSSYYDTGGHIDIILDGDDVEVRLQSTSSSYKVEESNVVSSNTWHHVAVTFGPSGLRLYVDGTEEDSDSYTGGLGTSSGGSGNYEPLVIGARSWKSGDLSATPLESYHDGRIDEVAIYDYQLSASEISALHSAGGAI